MRWPHVSAPHHLSQQQHDYMTPPTTNNQAAGRPVQARTQALKQTTRDANLTPADNPLVAVLADDYWRFQLQALIATECASLALAQLARVIRRPCPSFVQLTNLLCILLLHGTRWSGMTNCDKDQ